MRPSLRRRSATGARPAPSAPPVKGPAPVVGMVERFSRTLVMGWVSVPASTPPLAVTLHVGKVLSLIHI